MGVNKLTTRMPVSLSVIEVIYLLDRGSSPAELQVCPDIREIGVWDLIGIQLMF